MRVIRFENKLTDLTLTEEEISKIKPMELYYKYSSDQMMFREYSPINQNYSLFLHSDPMNGTFFYNSSEAKYPLNFTSLNTSCFLKHCVTRLKPRQSSYIFLYHSGRGQLPNISETIAFTY